MVSGMSLKLIVILLNIIIIGSSERIVQTPVPLTYARHTSRFLSMFCLTAPIALVGELGAYVVPFVGIIAWSLFGIQEIGK
jgi:putative membrane protein